MSDSSRRVAEVLREAQPFFFWPNDGNIGDLLIAEASRQFFRREGLLYEVFRKLLSDVQKHDTEFIKIMSSGMLPKQKLTELHFKMMRLMIANYNYSQAVTKYILFNRNDDFGMESLPFIVEHFNGRKTIEDCRLIAFELTSIHELSVLRYETIKSSCNIDLTDDETLKWYICQNINRFLD